MSPRIRLSLWVLSSLAVLWTIVTAGVALFGARVVDPEDPTEGTTVLLLLSLVWLVMLGLDALFIHLVIATLRARRRTAQERPPPPPR